MRQWSKLGAVLLLCSCARGAEPRASVAARPSGPVAVVPAPDSVRALAKGALLLPDLGTWRRSASVSREAQPFFDQGLRLTYGFNHDEAARSYARAAELDPSCAICFWGTALVLGPNYNAPMLPDRAKAAWEALQRARALAGKRASPVERALIGALARRYQGPEPLDPKAMAPLSEAYADAMRDVAEQFPEDADVQVLFAEAMMDLAPWKLWSLDGQPAPRTEAIVTILEAELARTPLHPGANHYYIHAIEASPHPERGLAAAERLPGLMPGAGHVVHMPAHIFQRVGRYADASDANARAVEVDRAYLHRTTPPGYYGMYVGHNYGFLAFSAAMEGRSADSLHAARQAAKALPPEMLTMMPGMDFFVAEPLLAMVRFGRWDDLLAEPRPDPKYVVLTGFWLHAHGMALAAHGSYDDAASDLAELLRLSDHAPADLTAGNNSARDVLMLAARVLDARLATLMKKPNALALWADATARADKLSYSEPDDWFYPVRHFEGAALLGAGKAAAAEAVYREDLRRHAHNGWVLFGLWNALALQKKNAEASSVRAEWATAWQRADFRLTTTAF